MFKRSNISTNLNLFTDEKNHYRGKTLEQFESPSQWHNIFHKQVTSRIDESVFSVLFPSNTGAPNVPIRVLIGMMVLKEASGLSDQKLYEECRFNSLTRAALGLMNSDDSVPVESTYYLFRKRIAEHAQFHGENLFEVCFERLTQSQCKEFEISGKRIRMDSKLMGSNIARMSRYELIHETLRIALKGVSIDSLGLSKQDADLVNEIISSEGQKVVYTRTTEEVKSKLVILGELIGKILSAEQSVSSKSMQTLKRVFAEQYQVVEETSEVLSIDSKSISASSVQSPYDTDAAYRNKGDQQVKGYSMNVTETCEDSNAINLILNIAVKQATASDSNFLKTSVENSSLLVEDKVEYIHVDGAYHSPANQEFCKENDVTLYLHAIQGAKGRFSFSRNESGDLIVTDTQTDEIHIATEHTTKLGKRKWRIKLTKGYRYFDQSELKSDELRKLIEQTPIEIFQKRNNVEATIFQLGYHYSNAKTRYRGIIKHQMWANMRCLWINFVRIAKYIGLSALNPCFLSLGLFISLLRQHKNRIYGHILTFGGKFSHNYYSYPYLTWKYAGCF